MHDKGLLFSTSCVEERWRICLPPNYTLKLSRPGFGSGLKPLVQRQRDGVTPLAVRHSVLRTSLPASGAPRGLRHAGPGRAA